MIKQIVALQILMLLLNHFVDAQQPPSGKAFQVQLEAFGPASLLSVNFDSRFGKKENGLGFRAGLGGSPLGMFGVSCNAGTQISVPLGINYLVGKTKHLLELGGGFVPTIISGTKRYCPDLATGFFSDETQSYAFLLAGYRYQPVQQKRKTYRIFISPLFQSGFSPKLWGGASIGFRL